MARSTQYGFEQVEKHASLLATDRSVANLFSVISIFLSLLGRFRRLALEEYECRLHDWTKDLQIFGQSSHLWRPQNVTKIFYIWIVISSFFFFVSDTESTERILFVKIAIIAVLFEFNRRIGSYFEGSRFKTFLQIQEKNVFRQHIRAFNSRYSCRTTFKRCFPSSSASRDGS